MFDINHNDDFHVGQHHIENNNNANHVRNEDNHVMCSLLDIKVFEKFKT